MRSALGVYVHWPFCARICPYCDFNVYRHRGREGQGLALKAAILQDLEAQSVGLGSRELVSVFFGGGTPSLMEPEWIAEILQACRRLWPTAADIEVTLEANPTDAEAARFEAFAAAGVRFLEAPRVEPYGTVAVFMDRWGGKWDLIEPAQGAQA